MSFKRKNLHPKSTVDSNQPGTVPKIRISSSLSNMYIAKSLVANSTKKTTVA